MDSRRGRQREQAGARERGERHLRREPGAHPGRKRGAPRMELRPRADPRRQSRNHILAVAGNESAASAADAAIVNNRSIVLSAGRSADNVSVIAHG